MAVNPDSIYEVGRRKIIEDWEAGCASIKEEDKLRAGRRKISDKVIQQIKARKGEPLDKLANEFKVSVSTICKYQKEKTNDKVAKPVSRLYAKNRTAKIVLTISDLPEEQFKLQALIVRTKVKYLTGKHMEDLRKDLNQVLGKYV